MIGGVVLVVAAVGLGGAALAGAFDDDGGPPRSAADAGRAGSAAVRAAGGGEIVSVGLSDDGGATWDVDVVRDGQEVEVLLDEGLKTVRTERDPDDGAGTLDNDDRPLTAEQVQRAGEAAVSAVGGGGIESVSSSDDPGAAYEIEVRRGDRDYDVALDERFEVVSKVADDND